MDLFTLTIVTGILLFLCLLAISWLSGSDAPYVPTRSQKLKEVLKAAGVKKDKIFYELGCGDGRVVFLAASMGADSIGIEQSWLRIWYARIKAWKEKIKNVAFYHGNIFDRQYFPADIVYLYLLPKGIEKLEKKLQKELKRGAVVITQDYHFKKWKPYKKIERFNLYRKL